jgi:hypothetical protein
MLEFERGFAASAAGVVAAASASTPRLNRNPSQDLPLPQLASGNRVTPKSPNVYQRGWEIEAFGRRDL